MRSRREIGVWDEYMVMYVRNLGKDEMAWFVWGIVEKEGQSVPVSRRVVGPWNDRPVQLMENVLRREECL